MVALSSEIIDFAPVTDGSAPCGARKEHPIIGLSVHVDGETSRLHEAYIQSILDAEGIPLLIPASTDAEALRQTVECIDGLVLTGGSDIDGRYFGEETLEGLTDVVPSRDAYDFLLLGLAADRQLPVFGICRGVQVINVAFGGTMWQDLPSQFPNREKLLPHSILTPREKPAHGVRLTEGSLLSEIFGKTEIEVNTRHHQAIKKVAPGFRVTGVAPDGVVEAIEAYPEKRLLGVQWHPENMAAQGGDEGMKKLFRFFVEEAALFRRAKEVHRKYLTVDSHVDTPMLFDKHTVDIGKRDRVAKVDLPRMEEGRLDAVCMVAYLPQGERDEMGHKSAWERTVGLLNEIKRQIGRNGDCVEQARSFADVEKLKLEGKKAILPGVENGYAIGRDLDKLKTLRDMRVVYMTLCHNGANDICDSNKGEAEHGGLSRFGREVVREMNRLGMVIDVSHAAESTFYDVLASSESPIIASHSSARALRDHPRNLTDDQIRALARKGGVIQVCLYEPFLVADRKATIMDAIAHIEHVVRTVGVDYVGIGSDFDGDGGITGCDGANELINLTVELLRRGYTDEELGKIWGGNLRRVVDAVQYLNN